MERRAPKIEARSERSYAGRRVVMPMARFEREIPRMIGEVSRWLNARGLQPSGEPFLRYHVIDMPDRMDVELGMPVEKAPEGDGYIEAGVLPAGRYAVLTYAGTENGVQANEELTTWITAQGEEVVTSRSVSGDVYEARLETFLNSASESDQSRQETEVAMKLRG